MDLLRDRVNSPLTLLLRGLNWLLPAECMKCRQEIDHDDHPFCNDCYPLLPFQQHCCQRCGQAFASDLDYCGRCLHHAPPFDGCFCPFRYEPPIDDQLRQFKYYQRPELARSIARLLCAEILTHQLEMPDLLIPVPLHISKLRQRGFNQAWQLTRHVSRLLEIPCSSKLIIKTRATPPQVQQSWHQRLINNRGSFALKQTPGCKHIAIIDDVVTTGSTVAEISKILKKNGVDYVQIWGIAHTV